MIPANDIQIRTMNLYPTFDELYEALCPSKLTVTYQDIKSISDSISEIRVTLEDINTMYTDGQDFNPGVTYIHRWLEYFNNYSNIAKPLTAISNVALDLYLDYNHFYLSDLKLIFFKILDREPGYGQFYGSIDAQILRASFRKYNDERRQLIASTKEENEKRLKIELDKVFNDTKLIVSAEFREKYGQDIVNRWKEITSEAYKRAEGAQNKIREEFRRKHGV